MKDASDLANVKIFWAHHFRQIFNDPHTYYIGHGWLGSMFLNQQKKSSFQQLQNRESEDKDVLVLSHCK